MNHTLFPISLVQETIEILKEKGSVFSTYANLGGWPGKWPTKWDYRVEHTAWQIDSKNPIALSLWLLVRSWVYRFHGLVIAPRAMVQGEAVPQILLQHDADDNPECTIRLMELERSLGVVSSCYFFRHKAQHEDDGDRYPLNIPALQEFEGEGFEIGYHQNAYERANYDLVLAEKLVAEDVDYFRKHFNLRSFVPHGGKPGPGGLNNEKMPPTHALKGLTFAYGGGGICTDANWSDGHVEFPEARELLDPRKYAHMLAGRVRGRMLFHPQYYGDSLRNDWERFTISEQAWWKELWNL